VTKVKTCVEQVTNNYLFAFGGFCRCYHKTLLLLFAIVSRRPEASRTNGIRFGLSMWQGKTLASVPDFLAHQGERNLPGTNKRRHFSGGDAAAQEKKREKTRTKR
jgi:hypothetical protein